MLSALPISGLYPVGDKGDELLPCAGLADSGILHLLSSGHMAAVLLKAHERGRS